MEVVGGGSYTVVGGKVVSLKSLSHIEKFCRRFCTFNHLPFSNRTGCS